MSFGVEFRFCTEIALWAGIRFRTKSCFRAEMDFRTKIGLRMDAGPESDIGPELESVPKRRFLFAKVRRVP